jgi:hypothetical protein
VASGFVLAIALPILAIVAFGFWPPWIPGKGLEPQGILFWLVPPPFTLIVLLMSLGQVNDDRGLYTLIQDNRLKAFHSSIQFAQYAPTPPSTTPKQIDAGFHFRPSHALLIGLENNGEPPSPDSGQLNPSRLDSISFLCDAGERPRDDADIDILIVDTLGTHSEHAEYGPNGVYVPDKVVGLTANTHVTFVSIYDARTRKLLAGEEFTGSIPILPYRINPDRQPRTLTGSYESNREVCSWISRALRVSDFLTMDCSSIPK